MNNSLILASGSTARRRLLKNAGVDFRAVASGVDESGIKTKCQLEKIGPKEAAMTIALSKAKTVATKFPDQFVLAADQILICKGQWFDKPLDADGARNHLVKLSGQQHKLVNAAVVLKRGKTIWCHDSTATMEMRQLNQDFINSYIDKVGETASNSVGAYNLEGLGIQLLSRVEGDFFSILGLPLLPLLKFLRERGMMSS